METELSLSTAHLTSRALTRANFSRVAQAHIAVSFVCVVCKTFIISRACHVSHVALPATDFTFTEHSNLIFSVVPFTLAYHFHSANWTLVYPICRTAVVSRARFRRVVSKRACKEAKHRIELFCLHFVLSYCKRTSTWLLATSMVQTGGAGQDKVNNLTVRQKKRSRTRSSLCHPAPPTFVGAGRNSKRMDRLLLVCQAAQVSVGMTHPKTWSIRDKSAGLWSAIKTPHVPPRNWPHLTHVSTPLVERARE